MFLQRQRKTPHAARTGPIKPGSPLYRLLEAVAQRIASRIQRDAAPTINGTVPPLDKPMS